MQDQENGMRRAGEEGSPEMRMEPLVDCVFLLLIFFMISTTFAPMPGIKVKLPPPGQPSSTKPKGLILRIASPRGDSPYGTMVLNDDIVEIGDLYGRFINAPQTAKKMLVIQAQRDVLHRQIVRIMDYAKRANVKKIGFAMVARGSE